jgi:dienelactone hydrolase
VIGTTVSHYRVLEPIGAGGMGIVYLAEDTRLHRKVAVKFLPPAVALDQHARARFMREAEAASALDHPNIATIYEIGDWEQQLFIAMAFYEGETLERRIERGSMAFGEVASIVEQLAGGLTAAHAAGIIHRDLKPANIMLRPDGQVKILDFGLAKLLPHEETATRVTTVGTTVGTVAYMSPEQARGEDVDAATDVWALGIMFYQMLAGRLPFRGAHAVAIMSSVLNDAPPPITRARVDVPKEFDEILAATLVKDHAARTVTASQVAVAVAAYRTRVASSERLAAASPATRPVARNRLAIAAVVLLLLAAAGGGAWLLKRNMDIRWATDIALPEINRLVDHDEPVRAFALGRQAQRYIPTNAMLAKLMTFATRNVSIDTVPSGAKVSYREYGRNDSGWTDVGTTPLHDQPVPRGWLQFRVEKSGFVAVDDLLGAWAEKATYRLDAIDAVPTGMVRVSAAGMPFSIFIPGLDHLPEVQLGDYWIDRYEVTNAAFKKFVDDGGYGRRELWRQPFEKDGRVVPWEEGIALFRDTTGRAGPAGWELATYPAGQGDYPVTGVSWYEAAAYAEYTGKALPTVYHWSRVASQQFSAAIVPRSNFAGRGVSRAGASAGMSRFGAYDMAGNVKEWCWNLAGRGKRYILGGGWNEPVYMFTDADARSPFDREVTFGFRCVKLGADRLASTITRPIDPPSRDYANETPVSAETFNVYRSLYSYDKTDLRSRVETVQSEDWREEKVGFDAAYGNERVTAYVFLPKAGTPPYQAVVLFPGSNALQERSFDATYARRFEYIVTSGRALVVPVFKSTYDRGDGLVSDIPNTSSVWRDHVIMWSKDLGRTLDYLETRPDIAHDKMAFMGVSWGGQMGGILPAVEPRLKAVLLIVGGFDLRRALPEVEPINFAPHITAPTLMLNGKYDFFYPTDMSQEPMFRFLGAAPDRKRRVVYETGHSIPRNELIKETLDWLDQYLGAVGRKP